MKNKKPTKKALEIVENFNCEKIKSDVTGSYTGYPLDEGMPVQDADDL